MRCRRLRLPMLSRRPALFAVLLGMLGLGFGSAAALPARHDSTPPPPSDYCSSTPAPEKPPVVHRQPAAALTPSTRRVVLTPGHGTTVRLGVVQPAQELDTFFLEDNGMKSEFTHCAFQGAVLWAAGRLARERDIQVGLGNFGDYAAYSQADSTAGFAGGPGFGQTYLLDSRIRPPDATFFKTVTDLGGAWSSTGRNATTGDQADLEALYQAVTGAGQVITPANPDNIPAGEDATFHPDAYRVVVLLAAHWFHTAARNPGYPGIDEAPVVEALHAQGVQLAGVWMDNQRNKETNSGEKYDGLDDLRSLVSDVGTHTGSELQCGSRGHPTYPAGGMPLCVFLAADESAFGGPGSKVPGQFGPILHNLVTSLANPQRVSIRVLRGARVVARIVGGERSGVDILRAHTLQATADVRCPVKLAAHSVPVELGAFVAGRLRATTSFSVNCSPLPPVVHAGREGVVFGSVDVAPEVGAAAPVTHAPPQTQAQTQPQPQPQPQPQQAPQGAVAAGFSEEFELSAAYARTPGSGSSNDALAVGALAMSSLAGAALRWRSRTQHCRA